MLWIKLKRTISARRRSNEGVFVSARCRDIAIECPLSGLPLATADLAAGIDVVENSYDLVGCVNHGASRMSGHYTATVECAEEWFNCNDERIRKIGATSDVVSSAADLLLYKVTPK